MSPDSEARGDAGDRNVETVILVDSTGAEIGLADKLAAHQGAGALHRAFSVFLFSSDGRMLIHRRASTKHHFRDLWTNACCSHPRPGETIVEASVRRVREELGIDVQPGDLHELASFVYRASDEASGLVEHEWDHVVSGRTDDDPVPDPGEVGEWRWVEPESLRSELESDPTRFTPWFPLAWTILRDAAAPV